MAFGLKIGLLEGGGLRFEPGFRKGFGATEPNNMVPQNNAKIVNLKITNLTCHKEVSEARYKDTKD